MGVKYDIPQIAFELHEHTGEGYVMLARGTAKHSRTWTSLNPVQKVVMITLIMMANHEDGDWWDKYGKRWIPVKRGQFITSLSRLAELCGEGVSVRNIRTALKVLEKMGFMTHQPTNRFSVITLVNYDFYQSGGSYLTRPRTQARHKPDSTPTTNNNEKNEKKKEYAQFVTMTEAEHQKLIDKYGEAFTARCIEELNNYKGANGKKYKSDYHAILKWVVERVQERQPQQKQTKPIDPAMAELIEIAKKDGFFNE